MIFRSSSPSHHIYLYTEMAAAEVHRELHFGDLICLCSSVKQAGDEREGWLFADGFGNNDLNFLPAAPGVLPHALTHCVFRVTPTQSYASQTLLAQLELNGGAMPESGAANSSQGGAPGTASASAGGVSPSSDEKEAADGNDGATHISRLQRSVETERKINQEVVAQANGLPVKYGQGVQLAHVQSGKYVTLVPSKVARTEKQMMKCELVDLGDEGSMFNALPRYKIYELGETVHSGDHLVLSSSAFPGSILRPGKSHTVRTYRRRGSAAPEFLHEVNAAAVTGAVAGGGSGRSGNPGLSGGGGGGSGGVGAASGGAAGSQQSQGSSGNWRVEVYRQHTTLSARTHAFGGSYVFLHNAEVDACCTVALRSRASYMTTLKAASTATAIRDMLQQQQEQQQRGRDGSSGSSASDGLPSTSGSEAQGRRSSVLGGSSLEEGGSSQEDTKRNQEGSLSSGLGRVVSVGNLGRSTWAAESASGGTTLSGGMSTPAAQLVTRRASLAPTPALVTVAGIEERKGGTEGWKEAVADEIQRGTLFGLNIADKLSKGMLLTEGDKETAVTNSSLFKRSAATAASAGPSAPRRGAASRPVGRRLSRKTSHLWQEDTTEGNGKDSLVDKSARHSTANNERFLEIQQPTDDTFSANLWKRSNGLFQLEMDSGMDGGPCKWDRTYRLRHFSTGMFLCIHPESFTNIHTYQSQLAEMEQAEQEMQDGLHAIPHPPVSLPVTWLSLTNDRDEHTLWDLIPTKKTLEAKFVTYQDSFALRMHGLPLYIHMDRLSSTVSGVSSSTPTAVPTAAAAAATAAASAAAAAAPTNSSSNKKVIACVSVAPTASDEDGSFSFQPADMTEVADMMLTVSLSNVIENFLEKVHSAHDVTVLERDELIAALAGLIHLTMKGVTLAECNETLCSYFRFGGMSGGIATLPGVARLGISRPEGQELLRDQYFVEKLFALLKRHGHVLQEIATCKVAASSSISVNNKEDELKGMIKCTYNLLECLVKGNKEIGTYVAKQNGLLDQIIHHLGGGYGGGPTLQSLLTNNQALLCNRKLVSEFPERFIKLITGGKPKHKQSRFILFAKSLCTCDGEGVRENQDLVCAELFASQSNEPIFLDVIVRPDATDDPLSSAKMTYPPLVEAMRLVDRSVLPDSHMATTDRSRSVSTHSVNLIPTTEVLFQEFVWLAGLLKKNQPKSTSDQLKVKKSRNPQHATLIIQLFDYLVASLQLLAHICYGGNKKSIAAVLGYFDKTCKDAFRFRWTQYCCNVGIGWMPDALVCALCEVTMHCFVNHGEVSIPKLPSLTRPWPPLIDARSKSDEVRQHRHRSLGSIATEVLAVDFLKADKKADSDSGEPKDDSQMYHELKKFIIHYLTSICFHGRGQMVATQTDRNTLTLAVLTMCNDFMCHGKYEAFEIPDLFTQLKMLLDPSTDCYDLTTPYELHSLENRDQFARLCAEDAHTQQLYHAKFLACSILDTIMNIRLDRDITEIMNRKAGSKGDWSLLFANVKSVNQVLDIGSHSSSDPSEGLRSKNKAKRNNKNEFVEILISLSQFPHHELKNIALSLLYRHFTQHETLIAALSKIVLLNRDDDVDKGHTALLQVNRGLEGLLKHAAHWSDININDPDPAVLEQMDCACSFTQSNDDEEHSRRLSQFKNLLSNQALRRTPDSIQAKCKHFEKHKMLCSACCTQFLAATLNTPLSKLDQPELFAGSLQADTVQQRLHTIVGTHTTVGKLLMQFEAVMQVMAAQIEMTKMSAGAMRGVNAVQDLSGQTLVKSFTNRVKHRVNKTTATPAARIVHVVSTTVDRILGDNAELLGMFCANNVENQQAMVPMLPMLISCMKFASVSTLEKLCACCSEIFKNNRVLLLNLVTFELLLDIIEILKIQQRMHGFLPVSPLYILKHLLHDRSKNGKLNLKQNQTLVLRALLEPSSQFVVASFDNAEEDYEKHIARMDGDLNNYSQEFHIALMRLLRACCDGGVPTCEAKCQSLLPLPLIMRIIKDDRYKGWVRDVHMMYLNDCYLDTTVHRTYQRGWGLIDVFWSETEGYDESFDDENNMDVIERLQAGTSDTCYAKSLLDLMPTVDQSDPDSPVNLEDAHRVVEIIESFLPALTSFFSYYVVAPAQAERRNVVGSGARNAHSIMRERTCAHQTMIIISKVLPFSCIPGIDDPKFAVTEMLLKSMTCLINIYDVPPSSMVLEKGQSVAGFYAELQKIVKSHRHRVARSKHNATPQSAVMMGSLHHSDQDNIPPEQLWHYELKSMKLKTDEFSSHEFQRLIKAFSQLRESPSLLNGRSRFTDLISTLIGHILNEKEDTGKTSESTLTTLTVLEDVIARRPIDTEPGDTTWEVTVQSEVAELGGVELVIHLLSHITSQSLLRRALNLAIALLGDGNTRVQMCFLTQFKKTKNERLFSSLQSLLRQLSQQLISSIMSLDEEEEELATELPVLIFRFLQLLCENHNSRLQQYLQQQENRRSFDLVTSSCQFLLDIEPHVNPRNAKVVRQLLDALTEFTQGPCSSNQEALFRAKLPRCINRFLRNFRLRNENLWNPELEPDFCTTIVGIKVAMVNTLLSVLEGREDDELCKRLAAAMDFVELEACITDSYSAIARATDGTPENSDNRFYDLSKSKVFQLQTHNYEMSLAIDCEPAHLSLGFCTITLLRTFIQDLPLYSKVAFPTAPWLLEPGKAAPQKQSDTDESAFLRCSFFFFSRQMASCEIVWGDLLTKIHFPVHRSLLEHLSAQTQKDIIRDAMQFETPQERIDSACEGFLDVFEQVDHEVTVKEKLPIFALLNEHKETLARIGLLLTIVMNLLLLFDDSADNRANGVYAPEAGTGRMQPAPSVPTFHYLVGFASLKIAITVGLLIIYIVIELPVLVKKRLHQHREQAKHALVETQAKAQKQKEVQFADIPYKTV